MENFFFRYSENLKFQKNDFLYDNNSYIDEHTLHTPETTTTLPFSVLFFKNLKYDFLIISIDQYFYRVNKYRKQIEEIGLIKDPLLEVSINNDNIVLITTKEIMLFNGYFDLVRSIEIDLEQILDEKFIITKLDAVKIADHSTMHQTTQSLHLVWAEDSFCVLGKSCSVIFNLQLEIVSKIQQHIKAMAFISKYNKFACAVNNKIQFFEPNGLEHGDPLMVESNIVDILNVDGSELLVFYKDGVVQVYFMKNFYWYKKMEIFGEYFASEGNALILKKDNSIVKHFVYTETNESFVIDGSNLNYTNYLRALIPPPLFYKSLKLDSQIKNFYRNENILIILTQNAIYNYSINNEDHFTLIGKHDLDELYFTRLINDEDVVNDVLVLNNQILVRIKNRIFEIKKELSQIKEISTKLIDQALDGKQVLRIYNIQEELGILFTDGMFFYKKMQKFNINTEKSFNLQFSKPKSRSGENECVKKPDGLCCRTIYVLSDKCLQYYENEDFKILPDIYSFIVYKTYLIYTANNQLVISEDGQIISTSYADDGLVPLAVANNKIVCQTRFGSLEATTNKVFSRFLISNLIKAGNFKEAAEECNRNHVTYDIFYKDRKCPASVIEQLSDACVFSLVSVFEFPTPVLHENDCLQRILKVFNINQIYTNYIGTEDDFKDRINGINDGGTYIQDESIKNILESPYHKPLFDLSKSSGISGDYLDLDDPIMSLNIILRRLDPVKHFSTIIDLFICIDRVDLCFYLSDLSKAIKILINKTSTRDILNSSMRTLSFDKIMQAFKICQSDSSSFSAFYNSRQNLAFSIYNYIGNRNLALYNLVKDCEDGSFVESDADCDDNESVICGYAAKYNLNEQLLMLQFYGISKSNFYCSLAKTAIPAQAFVLYVRGKDNIRALEVAKEHLLWREALRIFDSVDVINEFAEKLQEKRRFIEAGDIQEKYLHNHEVAMKFYLLDGEFKEALDIYKRCDASKEQYHWLMSIKELFEQTVCEVLKNHIVELDELLTHFYKYRNRLEEVRIRLEENISMSQTTFSYTSVKSSKNALIKDRPGGVYENEYILNKVAGIVNEISGWKKRMRNILEASKYFKLEQCVRTCEDTMKKISSKRKQEINELWMFERADHDPRRPVITKPDLTGWD